MKEHEKQYFEDLLVKAVQSGKKETSGVARDILTKIDSNIGVSVEKYVNGHLREIKEHLSRQDITQNEIKGEIVEVKEEQKRVQIELLKLQRDTEPAIKTTTFITSLRSIVLWIATPATILWGIYKYLIK